MSIQQASASPPLNSIAVASCVCRLDGTGRDRIFAGHQPFHKSSIFLRARSISSMGAEALQVQPRVCSRLRTLVVIRNWGGGGGRGLGSSSGVGATGNLDMQQAECLRMPSEECLETAVLGARSGWKVLLWWTRRGRLAATSELEAAETLRNHRSGGELPLAPHGRCHTQCRHSEAPSASAFLRSRGRQLSPAALRLQQ